MRYDFENKLDKDPRKEREKRYGKYLPQNLFAFRICSKTQKGNDHT